MSKTIFLILLSINTIAITAFGDIQKANTYSHPKSKCQVKTSAEEYPTCRVMKGKKELISLPCESGVTVLFSPSGKYIALGGGEISPAYKDKDGEFGLAIFNCSTEKMKGYLPTNCSKDAGAGVCIMNYYTPIKWKNNEMALEYSGEVDGTRITKKLLKFTKEISLP